MTATIDQVRKFHLAFGHPVRAQPLMIEPKEAELRVKLIAEELAEYAAACGVQLELRIHPVPLDGDIREARAYIYAEAWPRTQYATSTTLAADALADLDYVIAGSSLCHGFPHTLVVNEVHHSNMSKLGVDGKPLKRDDGKILKGPSYFEPDIEAILRVHGMASE